MAVKHRDQVRLESHLEALDRLRRQRNLWNEHQSAEILIEAMIDGLQINFCFTAPGHSMKQNWLGFPGIYRVNDCFQGFVLFRVQFESGAWDEPFVRVRVAVGRLEFYLQQTAVDQLLNRTIFSRGALLQFPPANWFADLDHQPQQFRLPRSLQLKGL